jgi:membrane-bound lytic murein transglycosylase D
MRRLAVLGCMIALMAPPRAFAREHDAADDAPRPGADAEHEPEAAAAIVAARADLDAMVSSLLREEAAPDPDAPALQVEVTPPSLSSEAPAPAIEAKAGPDLEWLQGIALPDIPIRWHDRLTELLTYYRDDAHGRAHIRNWLQRAGRYEAMVKQQLTELGLPQDLIFVAMVESGFEPSAESPAGAVGMWQLVETTGRDYGLEKSRWVDERRSPERATTAAVRYLKDLHDKLGSWPLSLAAFNMGYGALLRSVRKYNTNDLWLLARLEAGLPYETIAYVAKVMACAVVARNPERFGLTDVVKDRPLDTRTVQVPGGTSLGRVASAAGISLDVLRELNPDLLRKRVPPDVKQWGVRIPSDKADRFAKRWPELQPKTPAHAAHVLLFGERLSDVASMYGTTEAKLRALNDLRDDDVVRPGARILVPDVEPEAKPKEGDKDKLVVGVPEQSFDYPGRRHIFYRVRGGDALPQIASFFGVTLDELRSWNDVSTDASLQFGMVLQLFVPNEVDLTRTVYLTPEQVQTLVVGSDEFFAYHEAQRDRVRVRYHVKANDTLGSLAQRFDLSVGSIARINGWKGARTLAADSELILYVPTKQAASLDARQAARD